MHKALSIIQYTKAASNRRKTIGSKKDAKLYENVQK